jgi:dedicator of cytokinesis protein 3
MDQFVIYNSKLFFMEQKNYADISFMQEEYVEVIEDFLDFLASVELDNLRPKLLQRLFDMHLKRDNFVEAAQVLQKVVDEENRISILEDILQLLEKGKAWELAIETCKTLALHFEDGVHVDYGLASKYYTKLAELYRNIWNADPFPGLIHGDALVRYHPQFYLVTFGGHGWSTSLQNKTMIYQAGEWERLDEFKRRILSQHPGSVFYRKEEWETLEERPQRALLISPLTPKSLIEETDNLLYDLYQPLNLKEPQQILPEKIRRSIEFSHYDVFVYSRQERRTKPISVPTDELSEERQSQLINLLSTWTVISVFIPKQHFPGVHLRSEILLTKTFELSPLQTAILTLAEKNEQLNYLQKIYSKSDVEVSLNPLTMAINGTVDALVNGGITLYRMAFLESPSDDPLIQRLKSLILIQVHFSYHSDD